MVPITVIIGTKSPVHERADPDLYCRISCNERALPTHLVAWLRAHLRWTRGATKAKVLGALSADGAMTAGEVAKATGLARGTVSTTLTKLANTGEVSKAERGYRLPAPH